MSKSNCRLLVVLGMNVDLARANLRVLQLPQREFEARERVFPGERARVRAEAKASMREAWAKAQEAHAELVRRGILSPQVRLALAE